MRIDERRGEERARTRLRPGPVRGSRSTSARPGHGARTCGGASSTDLAASVIKWSGKECTPCVHRSMHCVCVCACAVRAVCWFAVPQVVLVCGVCCVCGAEGPMWMAQTGG